MVESLAEPNSTMSRKLLLGAPMYGYDNGDAIVGGQFLDLLRKHRPRFKWDAKAMEHNFVYVGDGGERHLVYYPSQLSVRRRVELAANMGTGLAVWEAGQALESLLCELS